MVVIHVRMSKLLPGRKEMIMKVSFDSRIFTKTKPQKPQNHAPKPTRK
jgi:hypothetical protein